MISKSELFESVERAMRLEEEVIPIYMKHCDMAVTFAVTKPHLLQKTKEVFAKLGNDSQNHRRWLISLLKRLEKDPKNAF